jgi:hypothetical protein
MRSEEFVAALATSAPSTSELAAGGLDAAGMAAMLRTRQVKARLHPPPATTVCELERLLLTYDCSTVEVGLLRFLDGPRPHVAGTQVAWVEADPVVVRPDARVALYDHADGSRLMDCAADGGRLLDALAHFVSIVGHRQRWQGRSAEAARSCAACAGGEEFASFYGTLCGFLDYPQC